ncbi:MAG: hypothetical protein QF497_12570 [Verrucomicrobiota bacterium]|jgi:hypothetical protein|nr:hypothetical protein [Verrucomicrobiota bacterium]MDP7293049.1 hypothetical protein [Verrucomicrobiota bacterium]
MIVTGIKAIIGITVILGGWLLVQAIWRRVFPGTPADEDVLAGRLGCCSRSCSSPCDEDESSCR